MVCDNKEYNKRTNKDYIYSIEHRKKLSDAKKGKTTWMKGKKHSEESKKKMTESRLKGISSGKIIQYNKGIKLGRKVKYNKTKCVNCKIVFEHKPSKKRTYCSKKCQFDHLIILIKKKESLWNKPRKHSIESRKKMSLAQKGKPIPKMQLENHPNWQGGKSFEPYSLEFNKHLKKEIRKRDNYTCQQCRHKEKDLKRKLSVHHIDYNKKNNSPNNLISLCVVCHAQTNYDRNDWTQYFENKVVS